MFCNTDFFAAAVNQRKKLISGAITIVVLASVGVGVSTDYLNNTLFKVFNIRYAKLKILL